MTRAKSLFIALCDIYLKPAHDMSQLEMQKLAYLLQAAGEGLKLNFVKHLYGPYADNLKKALQSMEGHYLRGVGDGNSPTAIRLINHSANLAYEYLRENAPEATERLRVVATAIHGFESPYGLELLTTVDWASNELPDGRTNLRAVIRHVQAWNERKRKLFRPKHIAVAWLRLRRTGWLRSPADLPPPLPPGA